MEILISDYAKAHNISKVTVYKWVKSGKLKSKVNNGKTYILADESQEQTEERHEIGTEAEAWKKEVEHLKKINDILQDQNKELNDRLRESNVLQLQNSKIINNLSEVIKNKNEQIKFLESRPKGFFEKLKVFLGGVSEK